MRHSGTRQRLYQPDKRQAEACAYKDNMAATPNKYRSQSPTIDQTKEHNIATTACIGSIAFRSAAKTNTPNRPSSYPSDYAGHSPGKKTDKQTTDK